MYRDTGTQTHSAEKSENPVVQDLNPVVRGKRFYLQNCKEVTYKIVSNLMLKD